MSVPTDIQTTDDTVSPRSTLRKLTRIDLVEARKPVFAYVGAADLWLAQVKTLPAQVRILRGEIETRVSKAGEQATDLYAQLAVRGERLVTSIRRQPATEAALADGKEAVREAEAAAIAAKKSVVAGEKAVVGAAGKLG